ncbi:hypothetical protein NI454_00960 [Brevundimonas diminuta]|uniref:hypothetical protein n=1 Tax=Brevundimonas TaxID=41275 RepID=UPI00209773D3|nr:MULTISPECIES: hypothetical protein [Brevundimonas]MCO8028513.1 hypothetical protein [Brevundimonas diminuta]
MTAAISPRMRAALEGLIQAGIDLLDEIDAAGADCEPDHEDEVLSEDDGVVINLREVGR